MNIETVAKIILIVSIGIYCLHLFLVFRQIFRHRSDLRGGSPEAEWLRFAENEKQVHKIVQGSFTFGNELPELPDEETEERNR